MSSSDKLSKITEELSQLTILEASELVKTLEEKWGVSAAPVASAAPAAAQSSDDGSGGGEKSSFDVVLSEVGGNKISVIKAVREVTSLGLKEAKDLVDGKDQVIKANASKSEAEEIKTKLEGAGAKVTLK